MELDCWDDTTAEIPVVYHGYTLTSKIPFSNIITAVRFFLVDNPCVMPIILSLENHCSPIYQRAMATTMKIILGEMLYIPCNCDVLPTPNELRGKVVLKGKRPPDKEDIDEMSFSSRDLGSDIVKVDRSSADQPTKIVEDLARLTLLNGVSFKNFETSRELPMTDMHSFSETKITKVLKTLENTMLWKEYNRQVTTSMNDSKIGS